MGLYAGQLIHPPNGSVCGTPSRTRSARLEAFPPNPFSSLAGDGDYRERAEKPIVSLPDVVVALNGPRELYVDAAFDLEVASEQDRDAVKRQLPRVRNETIEFLSQLTPDELRGSAELNKTKARLLDRFRGAMPRQRLEALYLSYLAVAAK